MSQIRRRATLGSTLGLFHETRGSGYRNLHFQVQTSWCVSIVWIRIQSRIDPTFTDILQANGIAPLPPRIDEEQRTTANPQRDVNVKDEEPEEDDNDPDVVEARALEVIMIQRPKYSTNEHWES